MHEYGLIQDVVALVLQRSSADGGGHVASVRIEVGEFLAASRESMETAYEVLTRGTALEGTHLEISEAPGRVRCEACGFQGSGADLGETLSEPPVVLLCPTCGAPLLVTEGGGIALLDVQLQDRGRSGPSGPDSGGG